MNSTTIATLAAAMSGTHARFAVTLAAERFIVEDRGRVIGTAGSASAAADIIARAERS
jgi:hypothetical protein